MLPYDPEAAKKLLAEAGYPNGFTVGMQCPNDRYVYDEQICLAMISMLGRIGIKITPQFEPAAKWNVRLNQQDISLYMIGHAGLPMADAYAILFDTVATRTATTGRAQRGPLLQSRVRCAVAPKIASELDAEKRRALIGEAVAITRNDMVYLPLHQQPITWASKKGVELRSRARTTSCACGW